MDLLNAHMRSKANLNCDKLRISYADCSSKSSQYSVLYLLWSVLNTLHKRWENILGRLTHFISLTENQLLWPWRKSRWSLCKASSLSCCMVPVQLWEALDLSQIAQPPWGLAAHCCELRRGRLWIAKVVPAFYRNDQRFRNYSSNSCSEQRLGTFSNANTGFIHQLYS